MANYNIHIDNQLEAVLRWHALLLHRQDLPVHGDRY